jgi:hypothetical protein
MEVYHVKQYKIHSTKCVDVREKSVLKRIDNPLISSKKKVTK